MLTGLVGDGTGEQAVAPQRQHRAVGAGLGRVPEPSATSRAYPASSTRSASRRAALFRDHVRGRGPRVRRSASARSRTACCPVSDLDAWVPQAGETTAGIARVVREPARPLADGRDSETCRGSAPVSPDIDETDARGARLEPGHAGPARAPGRVRRRLGARCSRRSGSTTASTRPRRSRRPRSFADLLRGECTQDRHRLAARRHPAAARCRSSSPRDPEFIAALLGNAVAGARRSTASCRRCSRSPGSRASSTSPRRRRRACCRTLVEFVELDPHLKAQAAAMVGAGRHGHAGGAARQSSPQLADARASPSAARSMLRDVPAGRADPDVAGRGRAVGAGRPPRRSCVGAAALAGWLAAMGYRSEVRAAMQELANDRSGRAAPRRCRGARLLLAPRSTRGRRRSSSDAARRPHGERQPRPSGA